MITIEFKTTSSKHNFADLEDFLTNSFVNDTASSYQFNKKILEGLEKGLILDLVKDSYDSSNQVYSLNLFSNSLEYANAFVDLITADSTTTTNELKDFGIEHSVLVHDAPALLARGARKISTLLESMQ